MRAQPHFWMEGENGADGADRRRLLLERLREIAAGAAGGIANGAAERQSVGGMGTGERQFVKTSYGKCSMIEQ